jgi:flagellar biosynthetic protein FliR
MTFIAAEEILARIPELWTFILLMVRYGAMMLLLPGIASGDRGVAIRIPAAFVMALATFQTSQVAAIPSHWMMMIVGVVFEILFGAALGLIPLLVVSGVQTGASLASTTMGLGAGALIDPALGTSMPELSRILGDLTVVILLLLGVHYMAIYAAAGLGEVIVPGASYSIEEVVKILMNRSADIFRLGVTIASPVIVALLLTNFVMGLLSKAVPSINIFIISFPLTIGIGLILIVLVIPELVALLQVETREIENSMIELVDIRGR